MCPEARPQNLHEGKEPGNLRLITLVQECHDAGFTFRSAWVGRIRERTDEGVGAIIQRLTPERQIEGEELFCTLKPEVLASSDSPEACEGRAFYLIFYLDHENQPQTKMVFTQGRELTDDERKEIEAEAQELRDRF